ncbi:hypothetical protein ACEXFN_000662 [Listeria monocytogenes]|uniref:hypothetical protein n=1 Tax=Listeria TaxID=1637 RepID=UPI000766803C|nr:MULTISPECIES: hypothetical protein [Listeria]EIS4909444.1 hypothetical protein [Listeria innocua]EHJ4898999.1 hypothetical protein [Listeria monocytogenes]EHK2481667.1 hypothetical protein [Listeria monocytogenes]EHM4385206.1 hypothetical protein [Listeria monocytogenes]EHM8198506.1 hypothetical protein [Listeria monocytogenes]
MTEEKRAIARLVGVLGAFLVAKFMNFQLSIGIFVNFVLLIIVLYILAKRKQSKENRK